MQQSHAASVEPSRIRAIASLADEYPGTLRLFVGEDTAPTPDFIKQAAVDALAANKTYYTPNAGYPSLRQVIAQHQSELHGSPVDPAQVVVTGSGMVSIVLAIQATLDPGDSAIVISPVWPNISAAVRVRGCEPIEVPLTLGARGFEIDHDRIERAIQPNTRSLILASPGNPTGWTATWDDWRRLVELCERRQLWLIADGVYERLVLDPELPVAPSPWSLPQARPRTIIAQSFSKAYRMTGWRLGYLIAAVEMARTLTFLQEFVVSHAFGVAQAAAETAVLQGEPFIAESRARYSQHAQIALDSLSQLPGVCLPQPTGGLYVFPRLQGLTDSFEFCRRLVIDHRLGLAPGSAFGAGGEGHLRFCFAVDERTLREALHRFAEAWAAYRP